MTAGTRTLEIGCRFRYRIHDRWNHTSVKIHRLRILRHFSYFRILCLFSVHTKYTYNMAARYCSDVTSPRLANTWKQQPSWNGYSGNSEQRPETSLMR